MSDSTQLNIAGKTVASRLLIGSALYPSPQIMQEAIRASNAGIVTVSLRRQSPNDRSGQQFWQLLQALNLEILPNTAGCYSAKEAVNTALMAREVFNTHWIKLEVIADDYTLAPHPEQLMLAAKQLIAEGFEVFPYTTDCPNLAKQLADLGCNILMPWGSQIGSGKGLMNPENLTHIRDMFPDLTLIVDAGIGKPSHAAAAMELGYDGVLLNSAVALAGNPVQMAQAFKHSLIAGRLAYESQMMPERDFASPSTPVLGTPFWHQQG